MVLGTGLFTVQFLKPLLHVHNYMQLFKKGSILLVQQTSHAKCSESSSMKLNVQTANVFSWLLVFHREQNMLSSHGGAICWSESNSTMSTYVSFMKSGASWREES